MENQTRICSVVLTPLAQVVAKYRANRDVSLTQLRFYITGLLWVHAAEYVQINFS
jgi:hypothetical protein